METTPWFKFYTGFFRRQSIALIDKQNKSESIILALIKLICMATEINDHGYVYVTPKRPYKISELAGYWGKSLKLTEYILKTLEEYGEIEIEKDGMIFVTSWSEEQNVDKLELLKKKNRERVAKFRSKKKYYSNITSNLTVTECNASEEDEEENEYEKEYEYENENKNINKINDEVYDIISYLNNKLSADYNPKDKLINEMIKSKFSMGYNKEHFFKVIDNKLASWKGTDYEKYLQPSTLFGDKFGLYLNEKPKEVTMDEYTCFATDYSKIKNIGLFD